jgi:hypothetical protein
MLGLDGLSRLACGALYSRFCRMSFIVNVFGGLGTGLIE